MPLILESCWLGFSSPTTTNGARAQWLRRWCSGVGSRVDGTDCAIGTRQDPRLARRQSALRVGVGRLARVCENG